MAFDFVKETAADSVRAEWVRKAAENLDSKMSFAIGKAREVSYMPYSTEN